MMGPLLIRYCCTWLVAQKEKKRADVRHILMRFLPATLLAVGIQTQITTNTGLVTLET